MVISTITKVLDQIEIKSVKDENITSDIALSNDVDVVLNRLNILGDVAKKYKKWKY